MKKVVCDYIYDGTTSVSLNKIYDVVDECDKYYYIINDFNIRTRYIKARFKTLVEIRNIKLKSIIHDT